MKSGFVYILASAPGGVLYVGVTSNLIQRVYQHKNQEIDGFTKKYRVGQLVYYEQFANIEEAIEREKQLKNWRRDWKVALIEEDNPHWQDLYNDIL